MRSVQYVLEEKGGEQEEKEEEEEEEEEEKYERILRRLKNKENSERLAHERVNGGKVVEISKVFHRS